MGILNGNGLKPKGMHWRTFERLQANHDFHVNAALAGMATKLGLLQERLEDFGLSVRDLHRFNCRRCQRSTN